MKPLLAWVCLLTLSFSPVAAVSADPAAKSPEKELGEMVEMASAQYCQDPQSAACQLVNKFRQGQRPKLPNQMAFSVGPKYVGAHTKPEQDGYLALAIKPQGQAAEISWLHLQSDNEKEDKDTLAYIQSIRDGRRQKTNEVHSLLEKEFNSRPLMKIAVQKDFFSFQAPGYPNGGWLRQYKNEWIVIIFQIGGQSMRPSPTLWLAALPLDTK